MLVYLIAAAAGADVPAGLPDETPVAQTARDAPSEPAAPDAVLAVVEAAIGSGDADAIRSVVRFARQAHPALAEEIDALHAAFEADLAARNAQEAEARRAQLAEAGPFEAWKGQLEFGASRSTGGVSNFGLYGALNLEREGLDWRHKIAARAEIQETNSLRSAERFSAAWQPRRAFDEQAYVYGLAEYDRDPFLGFEHRFTAALGGGYALIGRPGLSLEVEGGPAFRHTSSPLGFDGSSIGGRASADLAWKIAPTLELKQTASVFIEEATRTGRSLTALDSRLLGAFRVRLSHELRYERNVYRLIDRLDTTSRATIVYDF